MNNEENVNVTTDNTAVNADNADVQATPAEPETKPTSMADILAARNKQLQTSEIPNQRGITKDITVNAGTKYEYTLTIQYPGIGVTSQIEDDATNSDGSIRFSDLMQGAVDNGVFVQPRIRDVGFWDSHKGYGEVAREVLSFLNDGIDGNLE